MQLRAGIYPSRHPEQTDGWRILCEQEKTPHFLTTERPDCPVLLCEGETPVWLPDYLQEGGIAVLSGMHPEELPFPTDYIGTAALIAMGCHLCRTCQSGRCAWGIATQRPELVKRLDPDEGTERLINLMTAWKHEIMEIMGGMGINSIEALRGNRLMLRAVGLTEKELSILGVAHAGE